jgi:succinoglycan biosynthesis protein ExoM
MRTNPPSVLIGIPSFRRPEGLRKLLLSLSQQAGLTCYSVTVYVADNDPEFHQAFDLVEQLTSRFRWPLISEVVEAPGISAARNAILEKAQLFDVDFLAMIDDDEVADTNWLAELLASQIRHDADVVGGPVEFDFDEPPSVSISKCGIFDVPSWPEGLIGTLYASGNLLLRTDVMKRADWPRFKCSFGFTGGEDGEFLRRMKKSNARFAWTPTAIAREKVPVTRACRSWVLSRSFRKGNINMRIEQLHGGRVGSAISLSKAVIWLGSAPISAFLLAVPSRRVWIAGKWFQSLGKFSAVFGRSYAVYGKASTNS